MNIGILGAGSIGCYLGGCLAPTGAKITLVGRPRIMDGIRENSLRVTDYLGRNTLVKAEQLVLSTQADALADCDLVLIAVKSGATKEAAESLSGVLPASCTVVSMQNGIGNARVIKQALPNHPVYAGMVPFNVLYKAEGHFHQGTEGQLMIETGPLPDGTHSVFEKAGLPLARPTEFESIQWGKLLINLNNSVNALSNVPLKEELSQQAYRKCVSLAMQEALNVMKSAGIEPAKVTGLPPKLLPVLMKAPDWLFNRLARKMLEIDPLARSSMWEDLEAGRKTEIDWINGEVVNLANRIGEQAPVNQRLIELMREAEKPKSRRSWSGKDLLAQLH
ncbi:MAG: 2-dehydropantoate 2-reductase [Limnobacter sp.]|nr:2-dehydropantoate 2-reductase [Limnobacter sp.]